MITNPLYDRVDTDDVECCRPPTIPIPPPSVPTTPTPTVADNTASIGSGAIGGFSVSASVVPSGSSGPSQNLVENIFAIAAGGMSESAIADSIQFSGFIIPGSVATPPVTVLSENIYTFGAGSISEFSIADSNFVAGTPNLANFSVFLDDGVECCFNATGYIPPFSQPTSILPISLAVLSSGELIILV